MGIQINGVSNKISSGSQIDFPGSVGVAGTLTYEDVANVDSIGIITARSGIRIGTGGTIGPSGSGIVTYFGDGSQLTGIDATQIATGNTKVQTVASRIDSKIDNVGILTVTAAGVNVTGVVTATSFVGSGANLTNLPSSTSDKIEEGNSSVEVVDTGTGKIDLKVDGSNTARFQKVNGNRTYMLVGNPQAVSNDYGINSGHLIVLANSGSEPATLRLFGWGAGSSDGTINNRIDFASHQSGSGGQTFAKIETVIRGSNDNSSDMTFHTAASATVSERLRITSDGKFLFGTSTPSGNNNRMFTIANSSGSAIMELRSGSTNTSQITFSNGTSGTATYPSYISYDHSQDRLSIGVKNNSRFYIKGETAYCKVGVNDDAPDRELVVKNDDSNSTIKIEAKNTHTSQLFFSDTDAENVARIGVFHGSGQVTSNGMSFDLGGSLRMLINSSGNVGINQSSPTSKLHVGGVGTFGGGVTVGYDTTYSPIQQAANTYYYTRADQAGSVSGSNIVNLATGSIKSSETIPISNMSRQSDAGAHSIYNSSSTSGSVSRDMSSANPFHPKAYGLTMGTLFRAHTSGNNGSGVIHYGANSTNEHFYVRYKYSSVGLNIGCDTNGSDVWTTMYQNDLVSDNNWYFMVIAVERNGTLLTSLNGAPLTPIRMLGGAPSPGNARFGLAGDPYADNDSRHRYATAWWYRGVISNELIAQEYAWLKTIWTGASLP